MTKRALLLLSLMALAWMGVFALDVRDFGAKGDGIADDTDAIQRAILKAEEAEFNVLAGYSAELEWSGHGGHGSSGLVFLPKGTYRLTRTLVFDRHHLLIRGEEGTVLLGADGEDILYLSCINRAIIENITFQGGKTQLNIYTDNNDMTMIRVDGCRFLDAQEEGIRAFNTKAVEWRGVPPYLVEREMPSSMPVLRVNPEYATSPELFPNSTIFAICNSEFRGGSTFIRGGSDQFVVSDSAFHREGGTDPIFHMSGQTNMRRVKCTYANPVPGGPAAWMIREPFNGRFESAMGPDVLCIEQSEFLCDKGAPLSILRTTSKPGYVNSVIRAIDSKFRLGGEPLLIFAPDSLVNILDVRGNQSLDDAPAPVAVFEKVPTMEEMKTVLRFRYYDVAPVELQFRFLICGNTGFQEEIPEFFQDFRCQPIPEEELAETEVLPLPADAWPQAKDYQGAVIYPDFSTGKSETDAIQAACDQAQQGDQVILPGRRIVLDKPIRISTSILLTADGTALLEAAEKHLQALIRIEGTGDTFLRDLAFGNAQIGVDIQVSDGRYALQNCIFLDQFNTSVRAMKTPKALLVTDSLFFTYSGIRTNASHSEIRRSWVCNHPLAEDTGFFANYSGEMLAEYNLFVPILPRVDIGECRTRPQYADLLCENNLRWFENHGGRLMMNCNRLGGEFGANTPVYLFGKSATLRYQGSFTWFGNYNNRRCAVYCHDEPKAVHFQSVISNMESWLGPGAPYNVMLRDADTDLDIPRAVLPQIKSSALNLYR